MDGHHGIHCYQQLAIRYKLYKEDGSPLPREDLDGLKGEDWCEWIDWMDDIYTMSLSDELYRVESIDGDIWGIHPDAQWDDEQETYTWETEV